MAAEVQETLRGLCYDAGWCYAVFWKLKQHIHKFLAWEEGFYQPIKISEMPEALSSQNCHFHLDDHIGKTVEQMSSHIYCVGEGIIGQMALTNNHQWIFSSNEKEYPTGFHDQFAAGIQTIAVISVHQGVVQLGSTQTLSEDLKFVAHLKELFGAQRCTEEVVKADAEPQREGIYGVDSHSTNTAAASTTRMPAISDVWSSLAARGRHLRDDQGGLHGLYSPLKSSPKTILGSLRSTSLSSSIPSYLPQLNPHSTPQQECIISQGQPTHSLLHKLGLDSLVQYSSPSLTTDEVAMTTNTTGKAESSSRTETIHHPSLDVAPLTMFWLSADRDTLHAKSCPSLQTGFTSQLALPSEAISAGGGGESSGMSCSGIDSHAHAENILVPGIESPLLMHHACVARNDTLFNEATMLQNSSVSSNSNSQNSHLDMQMSNLLDNHDLGELIVLERNLGDVQDLSSLLCDDAQHLPETLNKNTDACLEVPSEDVLERVFSSELQQFDNFIASLNEGQGRQDCSLTKIPFTSTVVEGVSELSDKSIHKASFWDPPMIHGSSQSAFVQKQAATLPLLFLKEETSTSCQTVECDVLHLERFCKRPKIESLYMNSESSTVPGPYNHKTVLSTIMQDEPLQAGKKRARPGENARPRPKDRQQIQDRVRELRSIIPSSAKCSIDALLEKTIKYMGFLQSMTKDADKWKAESKLQDYESNGDSNTIEGGVSWAVELGGQGRGCPLRVEDLSQPQHLLVEMLCEETGIFLEIADTIRGLGLTILKGLMESRNEKMWARFIVKADQDVHRVHIVWSLMQLLDPNNRTTSNITNLACG